MPGSLPLGVSILPLATAPLPPPLPLSGPPLHVLPILSAPPLMAYSSSHPMVVNAAATSTSTSSSNAAACTSTSPVTAGAARRLCRGRCLQRHSTD